MPETTAHPSQEQLSAYNLGQLPPGEAVAIESHISECEPCCDTIINLSSDDTFVGLLKETRKLPTDHTVDHGLALASLSDQDIPAQLAEHPRYEILGLIGKGGMGDVYRAKHRLMKRTVALKIINREFIRKAEAVDRFHREVEAAAKLSHPNVVTAHDAEKAGDVHFLAMEYVNGVNLSQTVHKRGTLPISEACDYIRQAAIGLQYAHEQGMVHRDIKPHNLMLTTDGTVKILDFGLASLTQETTIDADGVVSDSELTAAGAIMGTPDFISPEQADDARQADIRSDIYSLGATLYYLLTGRPPFAEGGVMEKLKSLAEANPESLKTLREDVSVDLEVVVMKMMAKDPGERYQTPAEVAEVLKSFSQSAQPRNDSEPQTQTKSRRWKPAFLWLTAVAALFVAALFAGAVYYVQTDHGLIRVEVTDPSLEVSIKDHTITMKDGDEKPLTIRPSEQTLIVRKGDVDFEFETESFQIRRGDKIAFKVELVQGEIVVRKDGKPFDRARLLVGEWRGKHLSDEEVRLTLNANGTFEMLIVDPANPQRSDHRAVGKYTTDFSVSPAHLDLDGTLIYPAFEPASEPEPESESDDPTDAAGPDAPTDAADPARPVATGPERERVKKHKFELIIELIDANTLRISDLEADSRPKTFDDDAVVLHRQEAKQNQKEDAVRAANSQDQLVGEWHSISDDDMRVSVNFHMNGKFEMLVVESPRSKDNPTRVTGRYTTDFSVSPAQLDLDAAIVDDEVPNRQRIEKLKIETIIEVVDANTLRIGDLDEEERPRAFGKMSLLLRRQGAKQDQADHALSSQEQLDGECAAIQAALRKYYMDKHPLFAASVNQRSNILSDLSKLREREWLRQIGELGANSPVSEVINSFPGKPYVTFTEVTQAARDDVSVVKVNLFKEQDGTCRFDVTKTQREKRDGEPVAVGKSITEKEVRQLVQNVRQDRLKHKKRGNNAALVYWQVFALLPELSDEDTKLLADLEKGSELGADARSLLTRSKTALSLISQLQPETPCRWELVEDGVNTLLPHLSKARMLARLLVLQARADAESGKPQAAVDHLTQAFLVARNVADGVLVQMVVGDTIESLAADAALSLLPKLDLSSRDRFAEALDKLPPRTTFAMALSYERELFGRGAGTMLSKALEQSGQAEDSPAVQAILTATKGKQESWLEELLAEYDKVIEASKLSPTEANKELARLEAGFQNSPNPLIQILMPSLVGTIQKHARVDARIAELKTSLGVAAAGYKDPQPVWIKTDKRVEEVWPVLRKYYIEKYPKFAALTKEHAEADSDPAKLLQTSLRREIGELAMTSPVTEELQTTGSPVVLFMEGTQYLQKEAMITRIGLYRHPYKGASDEYCGILVARSRRRSVRPDETYPDVEPISEAELRELLGMNGAEPKASEQGGKLELSLELQDGLRKSGQKLADFEKNLYATISRAAGIPNEQWEKFASTSNASTDAIQGTPLSWLIVTQRSFAGGASDVDSSAEIRMLTDKPAPMRDVHQAMALSQPSGYMSILQPGYITKTSLAIHPPTKLFKGTVWFEVPELYAGKVDFAMQFHAGRMKVAEFALPKAGVKLVRNEAGLWGKTEVNDRRRSSRNLGH